MNQITPFLRLVRLPNLLMIMATQVLVKFFFLEPFGIAAILGTTDFMLLVLSMIALAAAGNTINDIQDTETDIINKPNEVVVGQKVSVKSAYTLFIALNILGVGIGFYLSNLVGQPSFVMLFILPSIFLYFYTTQIKGTVLVGNLVVSIMVGMIIIMVGIFDLIPAITPQNRLTQQTIFLILVDYGIFAFLLNFLREIVKDQEDVIGDYNAGYNTLPVLLGRNRTNRIIFTLGFLPIAGLLHYIVTYLYFHTFAVCYALVLIMMPLLYFQIKIFGAKKKSHYRNLSLLLKFILVAGLASIAFYRFILL